MDSSNNLKILNLIRKNRILVSLFLSTLLSCFLLALRVLYSEKITYTFLIWNLFLAWIPLLISIILETLINKKFFLKRTLIVILLLIWLFFLPNSPYIVTDFVHLYRLQDLPIWYDIILIQSFAWNGLILGFLAIYKVQNIISKTSGKINSWLFVIFSLVTSSFGIYLGRYWRWNTWDLLFYPTQILSDVRDILFYPQYNLSSIGVTLFFSGFLIIAYFTFYSLSHGES